MAKQIYIAGSGVSGLAAALALAQQYSDRHILIFEQGPAQLSSPVMLHANGQTALRKLNVALEGKKLEKISIDGDMKEASEYFSPNSKLCTTDELRAALLFKVEGTSNISFRKGMKIRGLDVARGTLACEETDSMYNNAYTVYDVPSMLVLAESCEPLLEQLEAGLASFGRQASAPACALLHVPGVPAPANADLEVFSAGSSMVAVFGTTDAALCVATPAQNSAILSDASAVASLLKEAHVPADTADAVVASIGTSQCVIHKPSIATQAVVSLSSNKQIALAGPALLQTAAPLCLDVDFGLFAATQLGSARGVGHALLVASSTAAAAAEAGEATLAPTGLAGPRVSAKCRGEVRRLHRLRLFAEAPLKFAQSVSNARAMQPREKS